MENGAELGKNVKIGAFAYVGENVTIGDNCVLHPRSTVIGSTTMGEGCEVFPTSVLGASPQVIDFVPSSENKLVIGNNCTFRENSTVHVGSPRDNCVTTIGNNLYMMTSTHIGHDCVVGDHVTLTTGTSIAGHVYIGDRVIFGGNSGVHQFVRIGAYSIVGGGAALVDDLVPFGSAVGNRAVLAGINVVGLRRNGFSREDIKSVRGVYRTLFVGEGVFCDRLAAAKERYKGNAPAERVISFIEAGKKRPLCQTRLS